MKKQEIKQSEARILIYLSVVHNTRKHVTAMCNKLGMDYSYIMRVLQPMTFKGWLLKHPYGRNMYYYLSETAPLELARKALLDETLQKSLIEGQYDSEEPKSSSTRPEAGEESSPPAPADMDTQVGTETPEEDEGGCCELCDPHKEEE